MNDSLVWHYTDMAGFKGIVENHTLWAGSVAYLNDSKETSYADEILIDKMRANADPALFQKIMSASGMLAYGDAEGRLGRFALSATQRGDDLSLWRGYLKGQSIGYSIGLDANAPLGVVSSGKRGQVRATTSKWVQMRYGRIDELVGERAERVIAAHNLGQHIPDRDEEGRYFNEFQFTLDEVRTELAATCKNEKFEDEREMRANVTGVRQSDIKIRIGPLGPTPYVEMASVPSWGDVTPKARRPLPIRKVFVSPNSPQEALMGAKLLLELNGYTLEDYYAKKYREHFQVSPGPTVEVVESEVPIR